MSTSSEQLVKLLVEAWKEVSLTVRIHVYEALTIATNATPPTRGITDDVT